MVVAAPEVGVGEEFGTSPGVCAARSGWSLSLAVAGAIECDPADVTLGEESGSELTGLSPRPFGDVDGDGADEFAIGAPGAYNGDGAVYIYSYPSP